MNSQDNGKSGSEDGTDVRSVKADVTNVKFSLEEFALMFGKIVNIDVAGNFIDVQLQTCVTMMPYTAKRLTLQLESVINEYEKKYGPLIQGPESPSKKEYPEPSSGPAVIETKSGIESGQAMLKYVENLNATIEMERSFKIKKGSILPNRFLAGMSKESLGDNALKNVEDVIRGMNIPQDLLESFEADFPASDYVHFGFEENVKGITYKTYLEFYENIKNSSPGRQESSDHVLLHRGLKWNPENNVKGNITDYNWFPNLSITGMAERLRKLVKPDKYDSLYKAVKGILDLASHKVFFNDVLYQEVSEKENSRKSFDINFYRADISVSELYPFLVELCGYYSIPLSVFLSFYETVKDKKFGHISGGMDREGESFVTVYYGAETKGDGINTEITAAESTDPNGFSDQNAKHLYNLIQGLGVKTGFEQSFKMFDKHILADRFLTGFNREDLKEDAAEQITEICSRLNMPDDFKQDFLSSINDANILLFGFEGSEQTLYYKAYLEFGKKNLEQSQKGGKENTPFLIHIGYKWDVFENANRTTTYYTCYPRLDYNEITEKLAEVFPDENSKYIPGLCARIINLASTRVSPAEILYFEAKEENNPRLSFDINFYRANLKVSEVFPLLCEAAGYFSIPFERFYKLYSGASSDTFGHLTGGIDRNGRDFLTFYFGKKGSTAGKQVLNE